MPTAEEPEKSPLTITCEALQVWQRRRASIMKSRVMLENNRRATVATMLGYYAGMSPADREKYMKQAEEVITSIIDSTYTGDSVHLVDFVTAAQLAINGYKASQQKIERKFMLPLARQLPAAVLAFLDHPNQSGVSLDYLAVIVGETGDLTNYSCPRKVWRRLGCQPHQFNGVTLMGSTWRSGKHGKLPADEWTRYGYSPRRRSIAYLIGENFVRQNFIRATVRGKEIKKPGPYRALYDSVKLKIAAAHPDYSAMRCARHAMLLATKRFLKNLWKTWNPDKDIGEYNERVAKPKTTRRKLVAVK